MLIKKLVKDYTFKKNLLQISIDNIFEMNEIINWTRKIFTSNATLEGSLLEIYSFNFFIKN